MTALHEILSPADLEKMYQRAGSTPEPAADGANSYQEDPVGIASESPEGTQPVQAPGEAQVAESPQDSADDDEADAKKIESVIGGLIGVGDQNDDGSYDEYTDPISGRSIDGWEVADLRSMASDAVAAVEEVEVISRSAPSAASDYRQRSRSNGGRPASPAKAMAQVAQAARAAQMRDEAAPPVAAEAPRSDAQHPTEADSRSDVTLSPSDQAALDEWDSLDEDLADTHPKTPDETAAVAADQAQTENRPAERTGANGVATLSTLEAARRLRATLLGTSADEHQPSGVDDDDASGEAVLNSDPLPDAAKDADSTTSRPTWRDNLDNLPPLSPDAAIPESQRNREPLRKRMAVALGSLATQAQVRYNKAHIAWANTDSRIKRSIYGTLGAVAASATVLGIVTLNQEDANKLVDIAGSATMPPVEAPNPMDITDSLPNYFNVDQDSSVWKDIVDSNIGGLSDMTDNQRTYVVDAMKDYVQATHPDIDISNIQPGFSFEIPDDIVRAIIEESAKVANS